ncbi:MAG: sigma-70 family RNA polymerase sigma factor [Pseudomonadota bacterium]
MFAKELEKLLPHARAYARMLSGDRELADDIVQNACLKAWNARKSYDPAKGSFKAWMFSITRNEFLQHLRKTKRTECYDPSDLENILTTDCNLAHKTECSEAIRQLFALSPEQRDVFILVVAAGYSYEEAAGICGCSIGTIKSRINRARAKLVSGIEAISPALDDEYDPANMPIQSIPDLIDYVEDLVRPAA